MKAENIRVLIAFERSGAVRRAFRDLGFDAYSCDIEPADDGSPFHYHCDANEVLELGWHLMVAHPPRTFLSVSAAWAFGDGPYHQKVKAGTLVGAERIAARQDALDLIERLYKTKIPSVAIENPVGCINSFLPFMPKPQYIHPHFFDDDASKKTGLWLRNLPPLKATNYFPPRYVKDLPRWGNQTDSGQNKLPPSENRAQLRSETYPGIAKAMASQWGDFLLKTYSEKA